MRLRVKEIRLKHDALQALGSRMLPGRDSEQKVATLLRMYLMRAYQLTDDLINTALMQHPISEDYDSDRIPARIRDDRGMATEEVQKRWIEIRDIPEDLKITVEDLPKESKKSEENQMGIAGIIAMLGPELYAGYDLAEEKAAADFEPKEIKETSGIPDAS